MRRSFDFHALTSPQQLVSFAVMAGFLFAAVVSGVVVASGNLMLIAMTVGLVIGLVLLSAVPSVVWLILFGTLILTGPLLLFYPQLNRVPWLFSLLGFFLLGAAILYAGTDRRMDRPPLPGFIWIAVIYLPFSLLMLAFSEGSLGVEMTAVKRQFQFWGLMFALAIVPIDKRTIYRWAAFLLFIALLQLPMSLYQYIVLMPMRLNMPNRVVPIDIVAGTFEAELMGGGNSNVMAYFLIVCLVGVLAMWRDKVVSLPMGAALLLLILLPLGLGETKLALVMLPVALLAVYGDLVRKRPVVFALGSVVALVGLAALTYVYVSVQAVDDRPMTFEQRLDENLQYNFGEAGYYTGASLNRTTVVPYWWNQHGANNPIETMFGHGLGASFSAPGTEAEGHLALRYPGFAIGLTAISTLLWDVGLVGTLMYISILVLAWFTTIRLIAQADPGRDRALLRTLLASISTLMVFLLAGEQPLSAPSMEVLMAITLGMVAWRWRQKEAR